MLETSEIIRILLALFSMMAGILFLRLAHRKESDHHSEQNSAVQNQHKKQSRIYNIPALICFIDGGLFAYLPDVLASALIALILLAAGFIAGFYLNRKHDTGEKEN